MDLQVIGPFLSTLSLRRATRSYPFLSCLMQFLSTLSLRRATQVTALFDNSSPISIHALLAESDKIPMDQIFCVGISIHALLAESDPGKVNVVLPGFAFLSTLSLRRATPSITVLHCKTLFLSTLSLRRATQRHRNNSNRSHNFYPRSPCGERHQAAQGLAIHVCISIHALLAESDLRALCAAS